MTPRKYLPTTAARAAQLPTRGGWAVFVSGERLRCPRCFRGLGEAVQATEIRIAQGTTDCDHRRHCQRCDTELEIRRLADCD